MKNTSTQRSRSQWEERNSYGHSSPQSHGYERQDRYSYSDDDRDDIGFADDEDYDYDYESDRGIRNTFRENDNDYDDQDYRSGEDEGRDFQDEYEEDDYDYEDAGYSEGGRRGRRGNYEIMDRDDIREIGRRGVDSSYGGSSYREGSGSRDFSEDYSGYRPYGESRSGRLTSSYGSSSDYEGRSGYRGRGNRH